MTVIKEKISSLSISNYYGGHPTGSFNFTFEGGNVNYVLDKEDVERILQVAYACVLRKREAMAGALLAIKAPPLLGYDREKTIEPDSRPMGEIIGDNIPTFGPDGDD